MFPARDLLTELKPSIAELRAIDLRSSHQFEEEIGNASSANRLLFHKTEFSVWTAPEHDRKLKRPERIDGRDRLRRRTRHCVDHREEFLISRLDGLSKRYDGSNTHCCIPLTFQARFQGRSDFRPAHPELQPGVSGEISGWRNRSDAGIDEVFRRRARGNDLRELARMRAKKTRGDSRRTVVSRR
jgi:hypothetical protein